MHVILADLINLVHAVAWPIVALMLGIIYRRELPGLAQALGARISRLSAVGITVELVAAKPVAETVRVRLDEIREPSSTGPPPPSGIQSLLELVKSSPSSEYLVIDLRDGKAWLTSRLYLFASVLPLVLGLRCFVFVGNRGPIPRHFLGLALPDLVARALEKRHPWLREAKVATQLHPLLGGEVSNRYISWTPFGDSETARKLLSAGQWDVTQAEALSVIVQSLISPIDLFGPGQVEQFVNRFLNNPNLRRPHDAPSGDAGIKPAEQVLNDDWVKLDKTDEHARWIEGEQHLVDLLGNNLSRQKIILDPNALDEVLVKSVLRQQGNFVAATDAEGRFDHLIDRGALLDKVAARAQGQ
jgi:hypothetical protein